MVGKRDRVGAVGADVCDRGEGGESLLSRSVSLSAGEHAARDLGAGAIVSHSRGAAGVRQLSTKIRPPPRNDVKHDAQARGIETETDGAADPRASAIRRSIRSTSAGASVITSAPAGVGTSATGGVGRDAARDVRRTAGRDGAAAHWLALLAPKTLPAGVERTVNDSHSKWYRLRLTQALTVVLEIEVWQGELWAHLAITGRLAPPTLTELSTCRDLFLGDRKTIQVLPRKLEAAEAGARSVHLYVQLESDTLPSCSRACHPTMREQG